MNKFLIVDIGVEVFVQTTYVVYEVLSFEMVFKTCVGFDIVI